MVELRALDASLQQLGFPGKVHTFPPSLKNNERVSKFLQWVAKTATPCNYIKDEEFSQYRELQRRNQALLEVDLLRDALRSVRHRVEKQQLQALRHQLSKLELKRSLAKTRLQALGRIHRRLQEVHEKELRKKDSLMGCLAQCQRRYQQVQDGSQAQSQKVDASLGQLRNSVEMITNLYSHQQQFHNDARDRLAQNQPTAPLFVSSLAQTQLHEAESLFLQQLTDYTKKQFYPLADMTRSLCSQDSKMLDLSQDLVVEGDSEDQYLQCKEELSRLCAIYPVCESQRISAQVMCERIQRKNLKAQEEIRRLHMLTPGSQLDHATLRHKIGAAEEKAKVLRGQLDCLGREKLPQLLRDMASLQVMRVLHGNYTLKLARQQYYLSKQNQVISYLQGQRARHEILSMLLEVELRHHRLTHRLLAATLTQLNQWKRRSDERIQVLQNPELHSASSPLTAMESGEQLISCLLQLFDVPESRSTTSNAEMEAAVSRLAQKSSAGASHFLSLLGELQTMAAKQQDQLGRLTTELLGPFASAGQKPTMVIPEIPSAMEKLESLLGTLELSIKSVIKEFDSKRKSLQSTALLMNERQIFELFFTDPPSLRRKTAELMGRVDALEKAQQSSPPDADEEQ